MLMKTLKSHDVKRAQISILLKNHLIKNAPLSLFTRDRISLIIILKNHIIKFVNHAIKNASIKRANEIVYR